jgi:DNA mismatch repair protein MutS2
MPVLPEIPSPIAPSFQLEWDKLVAFLGAYAQSAVGRGWIGALVPSMDRAWVRRAQMLVAEMRLLVAAGIMPQLRALFDPTELLAKARIEGVALESEELRAVIALAEEITAWTELMRTPPQNTQDKLPELTELSRELLGTSLRPLTEGLREKILPDGTLADDASPGLRRIRREMERQQRAIEESLRSALRRFSEGGTVQDELITIRG